MSILKSTNSGGYAKLTKSFLLNNGFKMTSKTIAKYEKDYVKISIHFDKDENVRDMFTEKTFKYKNRKIDYDWFHPETIKEFLDLFNAYSEYIKKLKENNED